MNNIEVDTSSLLETLHRFQELADNDPARVIELLLLENHVLSQNQSDGFIRRRRLDFSTFPRFIELTEMEEPNKLSS